MFELVKIEVLGYKNFVYKFVFECSDVKFIYDKFGLNARECLVSTIDGGYSIVVKVEYVKLFEIINILEDINKRNIIVRLLLWIKSKVVNSNSSKDCCSDFKSSDYEFLLGFYKTSIVDKFISKYTLSGKQIEYVSAVLDDCDYDKYVEVLDELIGVFDLVEVESELFDKLDELGLEIDVSSCFNYEYLNFVFSLLIDNEVKVSVEIEKFIIGLMYECYGIEGKHLYTKFKKDILGFVYED